MNEHKSDKPCDNIIYSKCENDKEGCNNTNKYNNITYTYINKKCEKWNISKNLIGNESTIGKIYKTCCNDDCSYVVKEVDFNKKSSQSQTLEQFKLEICIQLLSASEKLSIPVYQVYILDNNSGAFIMPSLKITISDFFKISNNYEIEKIYIEYCVYMLKRLHLMNIYHGDPHLSNFMLDEGDDIKLIDFGLAGFITDISQVKNDFIVLLSHMTYLKYSQKLCKVVEDEIEKIDNITSKEASAFIEKLKKYTIGGKKYRISKLEDVRYLQPNRNLFSKKDYNLLEKLYTILENEIFVIED